MADVPSIWKSTDDTVVVEADGFEKSQTVTGHGTFVFFEGDRQPRGFRSTVLSAQWEFTFRFAPDNDVGAEALLDLLEEVFLSADARVVIDPGGKTVGQFITAEIHAWSRTIAKVVGYQEVVFTAMEVRA